MLSIYDKPELRKKLYKKILTSNLAGTKEYQWSARKAQLLAKEYKNKGGGYISNPTSLQKSLIKWTEQQWRTKSGLPSHVTHERYLPRKAIEAMTSEEYKKTSRKKRSDTKKGIQFSRQPKEIASKTRKFRT